MKDATRSRLLVAIAEQLEQAARRIENIQRVLLQSYTSEDWSEEEKQALCDPFVRELCIEAFIRDMWSSRFRLCPSQYYYSWSLDKRQSFLGRGKLSNTNNGTLNLSSSQYSSSLQVVGHRKYQIRCQVCNAFVL